MSHCPMPWKSDYLWRIECMYRHKREPIIDVVKFDLIIFLFLIQNYLYE